MDVFRPAGRVGHGRVRLGGTMSPIRLADRHRAYLVWHWAKVFNG
jgi:hypothetical protein